MESIKVKTTVNNEGILQIKMPEKMRNQKIELVVIYQPLSSPENKQEWRDFIEETAGAIDDETFFRHPQGELPERELLE